MILAKKQKQQQQKNTRALTEMRYPTVLLNSHWANNVECSGKR